MRWSKIKNIILLLLVMVNVFLLAMVGIQAWRSEWGERETWERTIAVLEKSGITFLPEERPGQLTLTGCRIKLEPAGEELARLLLGEVDSFQTAGARVTYRGPRGSVAISASGQVEARLEQDPLPLEGDDPAAAGVQLLSDLGVQVREISRSEQAGQGSVRYLQLWNGVPVSNEEAVLTWEEGGVKKLTFRRLAGTEEPLGGGEELLSAATALIHFLGALNEQGYVCSQVTDLYAGYLSSSGQMVSLTPVWYVETDTWPWKFAVDGATGAVTVIE